MKKAVSKISIGLLIISCMGGLFYSYFLWEWSIEEYGVTNCVIGAMIWVLLISVLGYFSSFYAPPKLTDTNKWYRRAYRR